MDQHKIKSLQTQIAQNTQNTEHEIPNKDKAIEALENEEEKKQNEDPKIDLKQDMLSMTEKMKEFNTKYNLEIISSIYNNNPDELSVDTEIDEADIECRSTSKKLQDIKGYIEELTRIDLSKYESWDIDITIKWIKALDDGRFIKYSDILRKGFISDAITAAELPNIVAADLAVDPFNVPTFGDRKKLVQHFKSLNQINNDIDEGAPIAYI